MAREKKKKILLLAPNRCPAVEEPLARARYRVVRTASGGMAVEHAKRDSFRAAVLISTSAEMDLSETALNLHDVAPSLEIIILVDRQPDQEIVAHSEAIIRAVPKSLILTHSDFNDYVASIARAKAGKERVSPKKPVEGRYDQPKR